tara:strand:- start:398 stop:847 length:450 start_codon:yes stop_codon:yes gene_type:complete
MKTSKIKKVVSVSEPYGKFKVLYHKLIMDNEDKIDIGKQKVQQIGWELTYEIQEKGQHEFDKAKAVAPDKFKSNGQTSYSSSVKKDDVQELIVRQSSLRSSVESHKGSNASDEEILKSAERFSNWVMGKEVKEKEVKIETKIGKDDLPF